MKPYPEVWALNKGASQRIQWARLGLALSVLAPSSGVVSKYLGIIGVGIYMLGGTALLFMLSANRARTLFASKVAEKQANWLAAMTILFIMAVFAIVYPIANTHVLGSGSDRDDALNMATRQLIHLRYPYYQRTYLRNRISPLPGSLFLAIPFVLLGNSAYQNFFWLFAFYAAVKLYFRDGHLSLLLLWGILFLSPVVFHELVTGGDLLANSLYITLVILVCGRFYDRLTERRRLVFALFSGIAFSSRANFVLVCPLIFSALAQTVGWKSAMKYMVTMVATFVAITMPFWLYDPHGFSPLHTANKLGQFRTGLPFSDIVIPIVSFVLAVVLSFQRMANDGISLLRNSAIILAFPVMSGTVLSTLAMGRLELIFAGFGLSFLFLGALSSWFSLMKMPVSVSLHEHI